MRTVRVADAVLASPVVETNMMVSPPSIPLVGPRARCSEQAREPRGRELAWRKQAAGTPARRTRPGPAARGRTVPPRRHTSRAARWDFPARCEPSIRRASSPPTPSSLVRLESRRLRAGVPCRACGGRRRPRPSRERRYRPPDARDTPASTPCVPCALGLSRSDALGWWWRVDWVGC